MSPLLWFGGALLAAILLWLRQRWSVPPPWWDRKDDGPGRPTRDTEEGAE